MTPEQKFYQWFRKQLPTGADCVRIETTTMGGMPDVNICSCGKEIWVELKCFVSGKVLIRPEQNAWMHRRAAAGGRVFLLALGAEHHVHVWTPEYMLTIPHGKYLSVTGIHQSFEDGKALVNFLFT